MFKKILFSCAIAAAGFASVAASAAPRAGAVGRMEACHAASPHMRASLGCQAHSSHGPAHAAKKVNVKKVDAKKVNAKKVDAKKVDAPKAVPAAAKPLTK